MFDRRGFLALTARSAGGLLLGTQLLTCTREEATLLLELNQPGPGEEFIEGDTLHISWKAEGIDKLAIDFSRDPGQVWERIFEQVDAAAGGISWTIPKGPSTESVIRLVSLSPPGAVDQGKGPFRIEPASLSFDTYTRDLILIPEEEIEIQWTTNTASLEPLSLDLSLDDGLSWAEIARGLSGRSSLTWTVPNEEAARCRWRLRSGPFPECVAITPDAFSIRNHVRIRLEDFPELGREGAVKVFIGEKYPLDRFALLSGPGTEFRALSLECPHLGCTPEFSEGSREFTCPCHGSTFDGEGCFLYGPANASLSEWETRLSGDARWVRVFPRLLPNQACG